MRKIHRWPVNSPHKGPVTPKMFPFDDVIMQCTYCQSCFSTHPTNVDPEHYQRYSGARIMYIGLLDQNCSVCMGNCTDILSIGTILKPYPRSLSLHGILAQGDCHYTKQSPRAIYQSLPLEHCTDLLPIGTLPNSCPRSIWLHQIMFWVNILTSCLGALNWPLVS